MSPQGGRRQIIARKLRVLFHILLAGALANVLLVVSPDVRGEEERPFEWTNSDWGGIGLLQTRNARFGPDGELSMGASFVAPYDRYYVNLQALPWMEGTFRYTLSKDERLNQRRLSSTLTDRGADLKFKLWSESYWTPAIAFGVQDMLGTGLFDGEYLVFSKRLYDFDFSFGIAWGYPGNRGTLSNPFAEISPSFASREEGFSGLGGIPELGKLFGGERAGLFGGIEYRSPFEGLTFKLEYDGNDYKNEPVGGDDFQVNIPWNYGVEYAPWPWLSATLMQEREEGLSGRVAIRAPLSDIPGLPKFSDLPPPELRPRSPEQETAFHELSPDDMTALPIEGGSTADLLFDLFAASGLEIEEFNLSGGETMIVVAQPVSPQNATFWHDLARDAGRMLPLPITELTISSAGTSGSVEHVSLTRAEFFRAVDSAEGKAAGPGLQVPEVIEAEQIGMAIVHDLEAQGFAVDAVGLKNREIKLYFSQSKYRHVSRAIGRAALIAANHAPQNVETISIVLISAGITTGEVSIMRAALESALTNKGSPEELWASATLQQSAGVDDDVMFNPGRYPNFGWKVRPKLRQHIGRPGQFHRYQLWLKLEGSLEIFRGLSVTGAWGQNIYHNFDDLDSLPVSNIQHVRTEIVNYLNKGENNLVNLTLDYVFNPAKSWYAKFSGGYLEEMFAGFGGEVLYRPYNSRWAAGIDIYKVYQREFRQRFGLQEDQALEYDTITGHATVYYDVPVLDLFSAVSLGRYLAQDIGGTIEVSRRFESGISLGTWFTVTDLSAADFGEGSFDKGIFISVPWDLFYPTSTGIHGIFPFRPLTRDGGQKVHVNKPLHAVTGLNYGMVEGDWDRILD